MGNIVDCYDPSDNGTIRNDSSEVYPYYDYYLGDALPSGYVLLLYILDEVFPLIITAASIIGNLIIILTLLMKKNRTFSTAAFFISLAVSDLVATLSGPLSDWIMNRSETFNMNINCKLDPVFRHATTYISSITLAVITIERTVCVCLPHKVKLIFSQRNAKFILVIIWMSCLSFGTFVSVNVKSHIEQGYEYCVLSSQKYEYFFTLFYPWINSSLEIFIPLSVILTGTIIIIYKLYIRSMINQTAKSVKMRTISITLINTNIVFVLTKLPWAALSLRASITYLRGKCLSTDLVLDTFLVSVFLFFDELNLVLNFYIYFLSGAKFRNDVKTSLRKCYNCVLPPRKND